MRTHDEILAELIRRKEAGSLRNRDVMGWLKLPSSATSLIFSGERKIQQKEMPILSAKLWPEEQGGAEYQADASVVQLSLAPLLSLAGLGRAKADLILELLPAILAESQSAVAKGLDPETAAHTAARLLWRSGCD